MIGELHRNVVLNQIIGGQRTVSRPQSARMRPSNGRNLDVNGVIGATTEVTKTIGSNKCLQHPLALQNFDCRLHNE